MKRCDVGRAFGGVLREVRHEQGMSQERLADICDFDRTYPSLLERGLRTPTLTTLIKLAEALNVPVERLVNATWERLK